MASQLKEREKKRITLDKIVVRPKKFCGEVLIVNDEFNFLMIDLGKKDGLSAGTILGVWRDGELLGKIRVEEVYSNISEASILEGKGISEGNKVKSFINSDYSDEK